MLIELLFKNGIEHTFDTEHCQFDDQNLDWEQEVRSIIGKERNYTITPNIIDMDLPNVESFLSSELDTVDAETAIKSLNRLCNWSDEDFCAFEAYIQDTDDDSVMLENKPLDVLWSGYADSRDDAIGQYLEDQDISATDHREFFIMDAVAEEMCENLEIAMYKGLAIQGFYSTVPSYGKTPTNNFECDFVLTDQYKNQSTVKVIGDEFIVKARNAKVKDLEEQIEVALTSGETNFKISNFKSNTKLTGVSKLEDVQYLIHNLMTYARDCSFALVCAIIEGTGSSRYNRDDFDYAFAAVRDNGLLTNIQNADQLYDECDGDLLDFSGSCIDWDEFRHVYADDLAVGYCEEDNQWYVIPL